MDTVIIEKRLKVDPDFNKINWVFKARSKDPIRRNIQGVNVSSGVFCCTDGHRLHAAAVETYDVPDGTYEIKSVNKSVILLEKLDMDFPDYERVFPTFKPMHRASYHGDKSTFVRDVYRKFAADDIGFNLDYLLDAYVEDMTVDISGGGKIKPMVIWDENECRAALVMPLRG
jgi:hypothetical protein